MDPALDGVVEAIPDVTVVGDPTRVEVVAALLRRYAFDVDGVGSRRPMGRIVVAVRARVAVQMRIGTDVHEFDLGADWWSELEHLARRLGGPAEPLSFHAPIGVALEIRGPGGEEGGGF